MMPDLTATPPAEYWHKVELLRRLEQIVRETSMTTMCAKVGISPATAYRIFWGERSPSFNTLRAIHKAYPGIFPELAIVQEDHDPTNPQ
jgi:hypothetical protein